MTESWDAIGASETRTTLHFPQNIAPMLMPAMAAKNVRKCEFAFAKCLYLFIYLFIYSFIFLSLIVSHSSVPNQQIPCLRPSFHSDNTSRIDLDYSPEFVLKRI